MKTFVIAVMASLVPLSALAADGATTYVGIFGGGGWVTHDLELLDYDHKGKGGLFGVQVGHEHRVDDFVFGVEADFAVADIKASDHVEFATGTGAASTTDITHEITRFSTVRLKIGRAFGGLVPYATGGLAFARNESTATAVVTGFGPVDGAYTGTDKSNHEGWTVGAGLEFPASARWSVKVEYLYADLGEEKYVALPALDTTARTQAITANVVRAGVSVRF